MILGFIGLGNMGSRMVPHLLRAGHKVAVTDTNTSALAAMTNLGAIGVGSIAELASKAQIVMLSLPGPAQVRAVTIESGGLVEGDGVRTVVDFSTTGPTAAVEVSAGLAERKIGFLDCPVSGGTTGAENA